ncbi:hypothetical protein [Nannocystis pusilla]
MIVIGGRPAGLGAALVLGRSDRDVLGCEELAEGVRRGSPAPRAK